MNQTTQDAIHWTDHYLLGYQAMDETHRDFVACLGALQQAPDGELLARLDDMIRHAEQHFAQENDWMGDETYPARQCHVDEHAAVLKSLHEVRPLVATGNMAIGRDLARELARWFPGHADYMDSALAQWMSKKHFGGKPVVLRRL